MSKTLRTDCLLMQNRLLAALPPDEFEALQPHLEIVSWSFGDVIFQPGDTIRHVYFPNNGMISLLSVSEAGQSIEIGFTGSEGMIGLPAIMHCREMPYQALVQADSTCLCLEAEIVVRKFGKGGVLQSVLLRYISALVKQLTQSGICNHFHSIEARLCRWLLVMHERSDSDVIYLTHEFLSHILGVQRTSIGSIAGALQTAGVIRYRRGRIEILDPIKLRSFACECYAIVKEEYETFLDC